MSAGVPKRCWQRAVTVVAIPALLLTVVGFAATPAAAASVRFTDARDDAGGAPDLTTVTVRHAVRSASQRVTVLAGYVRDDNPLVRFNVFYDTDASAPGPEYRFDVIPNSESFGLHRWVGGWSGHVGRAVPCPQLRISADSFAGTPVRVSLTRSCLRNPGRVRVAAQSINDAVARARPTDWAPRRHVFYRWVGRGGI